MLRIVCADITTLDVDAIVNAANEALRGGGGVDGAIHRAAGPNLLHELERYPSCPTGDAVLTAGHRLPARYVIHAVGPIWRGGVNGEPELLERAYERAFNLACDHGDIRTIAFPAISAGVYGYPKEKAANIALRVMRRHEALFDEVTACLFDEGHAALYREVLQTADGQPHYP